MNRFAVLATALTALFASPVQAAKLVDCPLRDLPFSSASPLMDIMLSPAASAAVETVVPGMIKTMPPMFANKIPPSFAAIFQHKRAHRRTTADGTALYTGIFPESFLGGIADVRKDGPSSKQNYQGGDSLVVEAGGYSSIL